MIKRERICRDVGFIELCEDIEDEIIKEEDTD